MRKWLALLAALFVCSVAAVFLLRDSREHVGGSASPSPSTAPAARGESAAEPILASDPAVMAESPPPLLVTEAQRAAAKEHPSAGELPTKLARVLLRARVAASELEPGVSRNWSWVVQLDDARASAAPAGLRNVPLNDLRDAPVKLELDLTREFDAGPAPPSVLRVLVKAVDINAFTRSWRHYESRLDLDLADVPARRCFEPEVVLEVVLPPPTSTTVHGKLVWDGPPPDGNVRWRHESSVNSLVIEGDLQVRRVAGAGTFGLPVNVGGAVEWLAQVDGFLPVAGRLDTPSPGDYNLGSIVLSRGETISGRTSPSLVGMRVRAVCLTPPRELAPWRTSERALRYSPDGLRTGDREAQIGPDGVFELGGLFAAGYSLELRGVAGLDSVECSPGVVAAPVAGLELAANIATVDVEVASTSAELPRLVEVRLPTGNGSYELRRALTLDKNGRIRVPIRTGRMHEFVCGERVVPVLVHEVGSTVNVRL
ncbi:MAG: hypothetical protein JNN27_17020 [Planctomycetes bacterium]|nr:hypothetical protein [Planctomycetota bacterium]